MRFFLLIFTELLTLVGLLLLSACNNTDPTTGTTTVSGQVVESQSRQPVGNGTVQVWLAGKAGGYGAVGPTYPCDANGLFAFDFDAQSKTGYILKAEAPPGYITDWGQAPNLKAGRKNQGLVVPVLAPAWVRLVLVDEPPKSQVSMYISGYDGPGDRLPYPKDTTLIRPALANFPKKIIWVVTNEKGLDMQYSQDANLKALDTVMVRIPF